MDCKIEKDEFEAVRPLFDNNGMIDGSQFISLFYRLRFEHRAKELTERIRYERKNRELLLAEQQKQHDTLGQRRTLLLTRDYTLEDLHSAKAKMTEAAVKYDRLMPGAASLEGFDGYSLSPLAFKEQIKMVFHVTLTLKELSAYIHDFNNALTEEKESDKDGDQSSQAQSQEEEIHCATFLVHFLRDGFVEKRRRLKLAWKAKKLQALQAERQKNEETDVKARKHALEVDKRFDEEDKIRALDKLRAAAKLYDKSRPGAVSMKAFEVKKMEPHVFKDQLKRVLNLSVTPKELGALITVFDVNDDGSITCEEFTKCFLAMGFEERAKELQQFANQKKRTAEKERQEQMRLDELEKARQAAKLSYTYTEEEHATAMQKLVEAAWRCNRNMPGAPSLDAFEAMTMNPCDFQEQLRRAFLMKVTPQELGAIMHAFDSEGKGYIMCADFIKKFLRMGQEERARRQALWREHQKIVNERKQRQAKKREKAKANAIAAVLNLNPKDMSYKESDFQSAFAKLTLAAMKYDRSLPGAARLTAFEARTMPAMVFKEQLKLLFNVKVSMPELWALVSRFSDEDDEDTAESLIKKESSTEQAEVDNQPCLNCKRFVHMFLRTGFEERERIARTYRQRQRKSEQVATQQAVTAASEARHKAWTEGVNFSYLEEDIDFALLTLVQLCYGLDPRQLPEGGLSFDEQFWSPAEFKDMLRRYFNVSFTPRQLGALICYFDHRGDHSVNVSIFLAAMTQLRVGTAGYKGKGKMTEERLLQEYTNKLKEAFVLRTVRATNANDKDKEKEKPWRANTTLAGRGVHGHSIFKPSHEHPLTDSVKPLDRYRLRLLIARRTGRLDLATSHMSKKSSSASTDNDTQKNEADEANDDEEAKRANHDDNEEVDGTFNLTSTVSNDDEPQEEATADNDGDDYNIPVGVDEAAAAEGILDFRLTVLPTEILRLSELRELWLCNHALTVLPGAISQLPQLTVLSLTGNKLESLPVEVCELVNLKRLYLQRNRLSSLPNRFNRLVQLRDLSLAWNVFSDFPEVVTGLIALRFLDFRHNQLHSLPVTLRGMKGLMQLQMEGNTHMHHNPPYEVLSHLHWVEVTGLPLPAAEKAAKSFIITPAEEYELLGLLKSRAAVSIANKLRRKKKKNHYLL